MARITFVSKPIAPPWNDSGKNLVRDLASNLSRHRANVFVPSGTSLGLVNADERAIYPAKRSAFAPALVDNARVAFELTTSRGDDLWHFFFAPNPRSSMVGRTLSRLRRKPTVHTIASAPHASAHVPSVLFADVNVVLSKHTEERFLAAGIAPDRIRRIVPSIPAIDRAALTPANSLRERFGIDRDACLAMFPGDLEFGGAAERVVEAALSSERQDIVWLMACRAKTPRAADIERVLKETVERRGASSRVRWLGETREIHAWLAASTVVLLPATDLYAKMDYPLVLLEAMLLERPIVVASGTPSAEFAKEGGFVIDADADALRTLVHEIADGLHDVASIGAHGRAYVQREHDPRAMASSYESLYDALL